jgi:hypothetical protein
MALESSALQIRNFRRQGIRQASIYRHVREQARSSLRAFLVTPHLSTLTPRIFSLPRAKPFSATNGNKFNEDILYYIQGILRYPLGNSPCFNEVPFFGNKLCLLVSMLLHRNPQTL